MKRFAVCLLESFAAGIIIVVAIAAIILIANALA